MNVFKLNENSSIGLKSILGSLGYNTLAKNILGSKASDLDIRDKAISRFKKYNKEYLDFLDIRVEGLKLHSNTKAGIIPLKFAIDKGEKANLVVDPMINWQTLSNFASITKERDWLTLNENWQVSKVLDIELWYFSKPFLKEAISVLRKPAKGFKTKCIEETAPRGNTDWIDFSIQKFPYGKSGFKNKISESTFEVLPHALIIWAINAISHSILNDSIVPFDIKHDITLIRNILGKKTLPIEPNQKNLSRLPRTGAWSGYTELYRELEHIAILAGVLKKDKSTGCAYSIQTEKLFEDFTMYLCESFAATNGMNFFKDSNDTSRIGMLKFDNSSSFRMMSSLRPDIILTSNDLLVVIDAKYKRHYDLANKYFNQRESFDWEAEMRHDLHQALSYSIFSEKRKKLILLTHPQLIKSSKYHVRRTSRNSNILVGYLPIHFESDSNINLLQKEYSDNLKEIIKLFT